MPLMKKLDRTENRAVVVALNDLGFTVQAIAFMMNKTEPNIYALLERCGRKNGRQIDRFRPEQPNPEVMKYIGRVFADPDHVVYSILGVSRALYPADTSNDDGQTNKAA